MSNQLVAEAATYTKHNNHKRRTSMTSTGFKPAIPAIQLTQTYALDGTAIGIGQQLHLPYLFMYLFIVHINLYLTT
jgi:hypothetical protein